MEVEDVAARPPSDRRLFFGKCLTFAVASLALVGCTGPVSTEFSRAQQRRYIETDFAATLQRLYRVAPEVQVVAQKARGILVFPTVVRSDPVLGERWGQGALRVANTFMAYYQLTDTGNAEAGPEAVILMCMSFDALSQFEGNALWRLPVSTPTLDAAGHVVGGAAQAPLLALVLDGRGILERPVLAGMSLAPLDI